MNFTSFTSVNNSKICDLYGAIFYTNMLGNMAFKRENKPLRRAKQTLLRSEQLKPDEAVIHHLGSVTW